MRTRKKFDQELKKEIAQGYWSRTLSNKEIESKGIRMGNVHRWVREFFGAGKRPPKQATAAPPASTPTPAPATAAPIVDIQSLSKRKIKRRANGRYPDEVKDAVMPALLHMSVSDVSAKTGINAATLYLWKEVAQKKATESSPALERTNGGGALVVRENGHARSRANQTTKAELLFSPASIDAQMESIRKGEGYVNIVKAAKELKAAHKSGLIEDYDQIDLRFLLGLSQLTGAPLRMRK